MSKLAKIIRMEFKLTVANKAFVILTILGPFLIAAVALLPKMLSSSRGAMGERIEYVALAGADPLLVLEIAPGERDEVEALVIRQLASTGGGTRALRDHSYPRERRGFPLLDRVGAPGSADHVRTQPGSR